MKEEDILRLVEETFEEEIGCNAFESVLGLESEITGYKRFRDSLSLKLEALFNENDLSK